jgi:hypothetical protein
LRTPIPEPVPKALQSVYVQASQDFQWLAEHDMLEPVARFLASLRAAVAEDEDAELSRRPRFTIQKGIAVLHSGDEVRSVTAVLPEGTLEVRSYYQALRVAGETDRIVGYHCTSREAYLNGELVTDPARALELADKAGLA